MLCTQAANGDSAFHTKLRLNVCELKAHATLANLPFEINTAPARRLWEWYAEVDPRVQLGTPWSLIDESMREISVFGAWCGQLRPRLRRLYCAPKI